MGISRLDSSRVGVGEGELHLGFQIPIAGGKTILNINDKEAKIFKKAAGKLLAIFIPSIFVFFIHSLIHSFIHSFI